MRAPAILALVLAVAAAPTAAAGGGQPGSFGPTPQDCGAVGRDYTDPSCTTQTRNGTFALSPHVVHAGGTLTGTITNRCTVGLGNDSPCPIDWGGLTAEGKVESGCTSADAQCRVRIPKRAETTKWQIVTVGITNVQGTGISKDYFAVVGRGRHLLAGHVRNDQGDPIAKVTVEIAGHGHRSRRTDSTGYYSALLKPGRYVVEARRPLVEPVESADCLVAGSRCRVRLRRDRRADFKAAEPLRYLAINAGNILRGCWEHKLCSRRVIPRLRAYIAAWKPDVILISEVYRAAQLTGAEAHGPVLPGGWTGLCGASVDRSGAAAAWDAKGASHEHECVAWNAERLSYVAGSALSAYGTNDAYGRRHCHYDYTGFRVRLQLGDRTLTAVTIHPDSRNETCRREEIGRYWSQLADGPMTLIGGDWNTESVAELQRPSSFKINYLRGLHWRLAYHRNECSQTSVLGCKQLDDAFTNFGDACTNCGPFYGTASLRYGSALGGYDGQPRADGGDGMDHRQILVDLTF